MTAFYFWGVVIVSFFFYNAVLIFGVDMDFFEAVVFIISAVGALWLLIPWYKTLSKAWPKERCRRARTALKLLPPASFVIILVILLTLADPTVSGSAFWTFFYIVLGFWWISVGLYLANHCFDLSWRDDVVNQNRDEPAVFPVIGSFVGLSLIYAGANVGDGPGWWCVLFAGGLGIAVWLLLGHIVHKMTGAFDTITIDRDVPCGIRMGFYLTASGLILAKASSGDWTSFGATVTEFLVGWYVLPLTAVAIFVEKLYAEKREATGQSHRKHQSAGAEIFPAVAWGVAYIIMAAVTVVGVNTWM